MHFTLTHTPCGMSKNVTLDFLRCLLSIDDLEVDLECGPLVTLSLRPLDGLFYVKI